MVLLLTVSSAFARGFIQKPELLDQIKIGVKGLGSDIFQLEFIDDNFCDAGDGLGNIVAHGGLFLVSF